MTKNFLSLFLAILLISVAFAQTASRSGDKYALIIGIRGYPGFPKEARLKYADADAILFKSFIQSPEGGSFQEKNILLLLNENGRRNDIYQKGLSWLSERVQRDDLVYFFFAGHGIEDQNANRFYFLPYDSEKTAPEVSGIPASTILEDLKSIIDPRHLIMFIDASPAAAAGTINKTARSGDDFSTGLRANWSEIFEGQEAMNMAFFTTSPSQRSWEDDDLQHGVFTWLLIKGMKGIIL